MSTKLCAARSTAILIGLTLYCLPIEGHSQEDAWVPVMDELAISFRRLERAHQSSNLKEVAVLAQDIANQGDRLAVLNARQSAESLVSLQTHVDRNRSLATQVATSAVNHDPEQLSWRIEQLRHNCVSCHATFRDLQSVSGFFPARRNTIVADIQIMTVDGQPKADRSNVVAFLGGLEGGRRWHAPPGNPKVSQKGRAFLPRVLPIAKGTTVDFPNDDTIVHNIFSLSKARRFDLDAYKPGSSQSVTFTEPGLVRLYCHFHPNMAASIVVLDNSYFALSNKAGRAIIADVPDGEFVFRTWHYTGSEVRRTIAIADNSVIQIPVQIQEKRRSQTLRNKIESSYAPHSGRHSSGSGVGHN